MAMERAEFTPLQKAIEGYRSRCRPQLDHAHVGDLAFVEIQPNAASTPVELLGRLCADDPVFGLPDESGEDRAAWADLLRRARARPPATPGDSTRVVLSFARHGEHLFEDAICVPIRDAHATQAWLWDVCEQARWSGVDVGDVSVRIDNAPPAFMPMASAVHAMDRLLQAVLRRQDLPGADPEIASLLAATCQATRFATVSASRKRPRA